MLHLDWTDLANGTEKQRAAFEAIRDSRIMFILRDYSPMLAGTFPIGVDIKSSDLDIVCEVYEQERFAEYMIRTLRHHDPLSMIFTVRDSVPTLLVDFKFRGFAFQVIGKPLPSRLQNPYRHMIIEERLLRLAGERAREEIRNLRIRSGLKTEPAFAAYFQLEGDDPFQSLLDLESATDAELLALVERSLRSE